MGLYDTACLSLDMSSSSIWALGPIHMWMSIDSTDEHTNVLDKATMTNVHWLVKESVTPDEDTGSSNTSKYSKQLPSQTGKPLEPIKAPLLGKGVTTIALTTHNG